MIGGKQIAAVQTSPDIFGEKNLIRKIHLNNGFNFSNNPKCVDSTVKSDMHFPSISNTLNVHKESPFNQQPYYFPKGSLSQRRAETLRESYEQRTTKMLSPRNTVRVYSPKEDRYVYSTVDEENRALKQAYFSLRSSQNGGSLNIGGAGNRGTEKQLDCLINPSKNKHFSANVETFQLSWAEKNLSLPTSNYESASFNIINHSPGQNASLAKMLEQDAAFCHRRKGVTEYCDLARVTAIKPNNQYNNTLKQSPRCFYRSNNLCTAECNVGKTYGRIIKRYYCCWMSM
eukprot:TRINITY_DN10493_c0_g2_i16.p1 TRINITY_DN10493_c0_g2~~TRINITY_DN10493_c0_g2_i16.p1  ORF type:complete len:287 (-),score=39.59 TRINITY_DN10493_c0_g2_i16:92-952(-)